MHTEKALKNFRRGAYEQQHVSQSDGHTVYIIHGEAIVVGYLQRF